MPPRTTIRGRRNGFLPRGFSGRPVDESCPASTAAAPDENERTRHKGRAMGKSPLDKVAFVLLIVSLLVGVAALYARESREPPPDPVRVFYDSKGGPVVFDHAAHTRREQGGCTVCHHYDGDDEEKQRCSSCHEDSGIPIMHAYHEKGADYADDDDYQSCMSCHQAKGRDPQNCRGCHK